MGILDWFKNRSSHFDQGTVSNEAVNKAIEKAILLTNPKLKILSAYRDRLAPAVKNSIVYLREMMLSLPPSIEISAQFWATDPALRAFFASASDIPTILGQSHNLRTLFGKYPELENVYFILAMSLNEQNVLGISLQGEIFQREVQQKIIGFSAHQARICGKDEAEVRRLLGVQAFEYLVAQALVEIGEERSERRELENARNLLRARLRLLQQQGPGLGTVFGDAPENTSERFRLENQLLENEKQLEAMGDHQSSLDAELECLREVLVQPEKYISVETKKMRLSTLNVLLDSQSTDVSSEIRFCLAKLNGNPKLQKAFVLARFARGEMPEEKIDFAAAAKYL